MPGQAESPRSQPGRLSVSAPSPCRGHCACWTRRGAAPVASLVLALSFAAPARADLAGYVNPLAGTAGQGATFPGASGPFGMVQPSPDTTGPPAGGGYRYEDGTIRGFSVVHLSGPGLPKGGDLPFMPGPGPSTFSHANETAQPGYYRVALDSGVTVELTAGPRTAVERYTFGPDVARTVDLPAAAVRRTGRAELSGSAKSTYRTYFVARFSSPIASFAGGRASFASPVVTMRVGISFVDLAGARRNLAGLSFEATR